ncbi:hypothetical protein J4471_04010 [Candidatus Woesearchaeota archaeon]|nr:hypothetical protein [Candidatus Woesearchaeota archaeon]
MDLNKKIVLGVIVVAFVATMVYAYTWNYVSASKVQTCFDSDGGLNARFTGNISGVDLSNITYLYNDFCKTSTLLYERRCNFNGNVTYAETWSTNCNNMTENTTQCSAGRCI